ncbi:hypothetical protein MMC21_007147 [Puttea exsequens]|nr:hypothetical protein [Puttea exsequens]
MFSAMNKVDGLDLPLFETRKALIIVNLQNDSFYTQGDMYITKNSDWIPRLKEMIPYFRKHGDIVWANTHLGVLPTEPSPDPAKVQADADKLAEKNREEQHVKEQQIKAERISEEERARRKELEPMDPNPGVTPGYQMYYPSSRAKEIMTRASAETRAEKRSADLQALFTDRNNLVEEKLRKPAKGQRTRFYIAGTKGAEILDDLHDVVDEETDLVVTKHHYSAFDQTSLLVALRTKMVTEVYLCGCLTNVGVYSTAADAVQHGLQVTIVEDCLGYRSEEKHDEALRQMADIMGANGITTEEIIEESGGRDLPESEMPGITLEDLNLNARGASEEPRMEDVRRGFTPGLEDVAPEASALTKSVTPPPPTAAPPRNRSSWAMAKSQYLGLNDKIGSGDSRIIYDAISSPLLAPSFQRLKDEVGWQTMLHRSGQVPRLVAVQGDVGKEGEVPIYRHPADESPPLLPFTGTVQRIRGEAEALLGQKFNHALIQLYRDGIDNISEHADKTLDIVRGSSIINISIGAERTMTLRTKKSKYASGLDSPSMRQTQRIKMPHNSIFVLGPQTNREWLHGVRADKRPSVEKTDEEKAFAGERISITFRQIGTFMDKSKKTIWGSGARQKTRSKASKISTRDNSQMEAMINAFGKENHDVEFDWDAEYGSGFDVVNLLNEQAKLTLCKDSIPNIRVQLALCEKSISFTTTEPEQDKDQPESNLPPGYKSRFHGYIPGLSNTGKPIFQDTDDGCTETEGDLAILMYLEKHYPSTPNSRQYDQQTYVQTTQANETLFMFQEVEDSQKTGRDSPPTHRFELERPITPNKSLIEEFHTWLLMWEERAGEHGYIAGDDWSVIDCAFWPVLNYVLENMEGLSEEKYPNLRRYHAMMGEKECVRIILENR